MNNDGKYLSSHPISLQVLPQLACVPQLNLLSHHLSHTCLLSALPSSPRLKIRGGVTCHRGTIILSPNISCYSSLNHEWNRRGKELWLLMWQLFNVTDLCSWYPLLILFGFFFSVPEYTFRIYWIHKFQIIL